MPEPGRCRHRLPWTEVDRLELRRLLEEGWSYPAIARALGRTPAAIAQYMQVFAFEIWALPAAAPASGGRMIR